MKHTDIVEIFENKALIGTETVVCGWVRTSRESKNMAFIELNDGTSLKHLQIVIDKSQLGDVSDFMKLGTSLKVTGTAVKSAVAEDSVEINAKEITVLGECPADYPLQKKRHTLEYLRTIPHLRVRTNTFNAVFRVRSVVSASIHEFFQSRRFVYVHTPLITASDCEGAGEMFKVTTIGYSNEYKSEEEYYANDFFGKKAALSVSGQLEGEVAAMALGKIYTFGPSFRAEKSNTPRHVAEFWHVEPEVAFAELPDIIELAEALIKHIINAVLEKCPEELKFFDRHFENGLIEKLETVAGHNFAVMTYTEAIERLKASGKDFKYPVEWGCDLMTEHERYISEEICKKPVFLTDYPKEIKSFYMKQNPDGKTVAATDLLVPGVGEIIGCSEREADLDKLLEAMKSRNMSLDEYEHYIALRRFGSVPHSGFGLGLERIIMYVTGVQNIRDVILYPRTVGSIS
ncbi:MAG TPA: asparagine--tRNA ligase [Ruminococcaceae bacterium]|nr:asparagine--tRNA ligase [Oscillospiraceae bacterium]HBJ10421.1 asparagine--tRNA ligase [Oscillospiraceae bacterium]